MAGATLEPAGSGVAGVQPKGITQQYQLAATSANLNTSTGITPRDSGNIVINTNPGKPPQKQTNGTVQRSSQLKVDGTAGHVGNALVSTAGVGVAIPTPPVGSRAEDGLSQAPQHE
jgi:hypothetical protein